MWRICAFCILWLVPAVAFRAGVQKEVELAWKNEGKVNMISIKGKSTGCSISTWQTTITCKEAEGMTRLSHTVPERAFSTVVDCRDADSSLKSLGIKAGRRCVKLTATKYFTGYFGIPLNLQKGQVTNFTCVMPPLFGHNDVTLDITAQNTQNIKETKTYQIGLVKIESDETKVSSNTCLGLVKDAFAWKLSLNQSSENVHELLWTSQPQKATSRTRNVVKTTSTMNSFTACTKDVSFKDLKPRILSVTGSEDSEDYKDAVQLQMLPATKDRSPMKHQEVVKLLVDAKIPKGKAGKALKVGIGYRFPKASDPEITYITLPNRDLQPSQTSKEAEETKEAETPVKAAQPEGDDHGGSARGCMHAVLGALIGATVLLP